MIEASGLNRSEVSAKSSAPAWQQSFVFEATQRCNYNCLHCYNVWKNPIDYPRGELGTGETLAALAKMLDETGASLVSLSGGEPLLRNDLHEIIAFLHARDININLITNGSLLDDAAIARLLPDKIAVFELPLLSADRAIHDRMSGAAGAFDAATLAIANLKAARQSVVAVFVATRLNLPAWRKTAELAIALGCDAIMFNRFNPGGCGLENIEALQASPSEISAALDVADEIAGQYKISISCSIPMPPCLFETSRWPHVNFGFCTAGTERAYYTLDPLGNVRPCNHSPTILGNIFAASFTEMASGRQMQSFVAARPEFCRGCPVETQCQGGCKAAAEAAAGSPSAMDPFLSAFRHHAVRPRP